MAKVHELKQDITHLEQLLEDGHLDDQTVKDTIEALEGEFEEKVNNILLAVKNYEKEAEAFKSESDRLKELATSSDKQAKRLLEYVDYACKLMGKNKFTTSHFKVSYRKGSEVVEIDEIELRNYPHFWVEQEPKPWGKTELKKHIKETGKEIPGVALVRKPDSLQVK